MAKIILEPGEQFEHFHSEKSLSELLSGDALIKFGDSEEMMVVGRIVHIPEKDFAYNN